MGNVGGMVAWLVRVACLHEWCASVSGVGGVLAWVPCNRVSLVTCYYCCYYYYY